MNLNIRTLLPAGLLLALSLSPISGFAVQKVAIVVANRADAQLNSQTSVFEDLLVAEVTGLGFDIISRDMVLSAVGDLLSTPEQNELDATLSDQTSALRLSQSLGADYLLVGTILGLDTETRSSTAYGVSVQNNTHTLHTTYRVLNGSTGGSLAAGNISPSRAIQQSANSQISTPGLVRQLLVRASKEISAKLKVQKDAGAIRTVEVDKSLVEFNVAVSINGIQFPEIVRTDDGQQRITSNNSTVQATAVSVEVDGITVGTTGGGKLQATPGLHRVTITRDDLVPFERMVNIQDGMNLQIAMELNESGRKRWMENTILLDDLKKEALLTDAEAEKVRGMAAALRQSGYKVDIKVDTDEGIDIENNQSLMNQN
jgi:hypothetical protein